MPQVQTEATTSANSPNHERSLAALNKCTMACVHCRREKKKVRLRSCNASDLSDAKLRAVQYVCSLRSVRLERTGMRPNSK